MSKITAPLVAFAYLAETAHEDGHNLDLISALAPLLGVVASAYEGKPFQATVLARELRARFGLRVNPYAVEQWIPQLKAAGVINGTMLVAPKGRKQVEQLTFSKPNASVETLDESDVDLVVKHFLEYARQRLTKIGRDISDTELEEFFLREIADLDFLAAVLKTNKQQHGKSRLSLPTKPDTDPATNPLATAELDVLCAGFFLHMAEEDPSIFDQIVKIASGAVIAEVLFDVGNPQTSTTFANQTIVLDAPVCIKALGLNSKEDEDHTIDLLKTLLSRGAKLAVFDHTVEEVKSLLSASLRGSHEPWGYGPTVRRIRSDRMAEVLARTVLGDVEIAIKDIGIKGILSNPTTSAAWALLPQSQEENLSEKLAWYENSESRQRDAASLAATYRLRGGYRTSPKQVHDARYLFLTENARLVDVAYGFFTREPDAPIAVTDRYLAGYLFVMCGGSDDITGMLKRRVLANCTNAVAPRTDLIEKMAGFVQGLDESHRQKYTAMMTEGRAARYLTELTFGNSGYLQAHNFEGVLEEIYDEAFVERSKALAAQKASQEAESAMLLAELSADHERELTAERSASSLALQQVDEKLVSLAQEQEARKEVQTALAGAQKQLREALYKVAQDAATFGRIANWLLYCVYSFAAFVLAWLGDLISASSNLRPIYYFGSALLVLFALHQAPQILIDRPKLWLTQWRYRRLLIERSLVESAQAFHFEPDTGTIRHLT